MFSWIVQLIILLIVMLISYLIRPRGAVGTPTVPPSSPAAGGGGVQGSGPSPGDLSSPTVNAATPVPVLFGTRTIAVSNCVWYGDVGTEPIIACIVTSGTMTSTTPEVNTRVDGGK